LGVVRDRFDGLSRPPARWRCVRADFELTPARFCRAVRPPPAVVRFVGARRVRAPTTTPWALRTILVTSFLRTVLPPRLTVL